MEEPFFLEPTEVGNLHEETIRRHGGPSGIRDMGGLVSAVMPPRNHWHYTGGDLYDLAAVLMVHLARNHPFLDGNKRVAVASALAFLAMNGKRIGTHSHALESLTLTAAQGQLEPDVLASALRSLPILD